MVFDSLVDPELGRLCDRTHGIDLEGITSSIKIYVKTDTDAAFQRWLQREPDRPVKGVGTLTYGYFKAEALRLDQYARKHNHLVVQHPTNFPLIKLVSNLKERLLFCFKKNF